MEIKLDKPLIVLDIEATGDQINKDRIVEIGMIKTNPMEAKRFTNKELILRFLFH
jgi:oligoribonuclease (3'-5' exoribonuclease)